MTPTIQARPCPHTRASFGHTPSLAAVPASDMACLPRPPHWTLAIFNRSALYPSIGPGQVWACVLEPHLPPSCGGVSGGFACYVFDEAAKHFLY